MDPELGEVYELLFNKGLYHTAMTLKREEHLIKHQWNSIPKSQRKLGQKPLLTLKEKQRKYNDKLLGNKRLCPACRLYPDMDLTLQESIFPNDFDNNASKIEFRRTKRVALCKGCVSQQRVRNIPRQEDIHQLGHSFDRDERNGELLHKNEGNFSASLPKQNSLLLSSNDSIEASHFVEAKRRLIRRAEDWKGVLSENLMKRTNQTKMKQLRPSPLQADILCNTFQDSTTALNLTGPGIDTDSCFDAFVETHRVDAFEFLKDYTSSVSSNTPCTDTNYEMCSAGKNNELKEVSLETIDGNELLSEDKVCSSSTSCCQKQFVSPNLSDSEGDIFRRCFLQYFRRVPFLNSSSVPCI